MEEHIIVAAPKSYPSELLNDLESSTSDGLNIKRVDADYGAMAGIEWALPTIAIAYIAKPFFESFLTEAGKDVYELLKSKIKKFIVKNRQNRFSLITATASTEKLSKNYDQSLTVSLKAQVHPKMTVTVLISENTPKDEISLMLDGMFQLLQLLYEQCQTEELLKIEPGQKHEQVYMVANQESKQWDILTQKQMFEKYRNN
jgi:hypothetical protein